MIRDSSLRLLQAGSARSSKRGVGTRPNRPYTPHRTRSVPGSGALPDARTIFQFHIPEREVDQATFGSMEALSRWKRPTGDVPFARLSQQRAPIR